MKLLALDIATKIGWASFEDARLLSFGTLKSDFKVKDFGKYPFNYVKFTRAIIQNLFEMIQREKPDVIVVEETNKGRARYTQKILEFLHLSFLQLLENTSIKVFYISSSAWRKALDLAMTKDDKKNNKLVNDAKRTGKSKKELGVKGKITKKHLAVRWANQEFGLNLKMADNDAADAIGLGAAYVMNAPICDGN